MKSLILAAALSTAATMSFAADTYTLDPSHSQIVFHYDHLGYSTTYGMFSGIEGEISLDQEDPAKSSVSVSFPANSLITGWQPRFDHLMTGDFFGADENDTVTFKSTSIEVTGEDTGKITGDLTINGITKPVVLDAEMTQMGDHPQAGMAAYQYVYHMSVGRFQRHHIRAAVGFRHGHVRTLRGRRSGHHDFDRGDEGGLSLSSK